MLFFGVQVYFNFFYALRALTTAILIIMAPMMVAMITIACLSTFMTIPTSRIIAAMISVKINNAQIVGSILIIMAPMMVAMITISSSRKQTTMTWAKELLANILVQPIHAPPAAPPAAPAAALLPCPFAPELRSALALLRFVFLGGIGGAFTGAGLHGLGAPISSAADSLGLIRRGSRHMRQVLSLEQNRPLR